MPVTRNQSAFSHGNKSNLGQTQPATSTESSEPSEEGASAEASRRDSPDNCSICLGPFNNKSFTSSCAHSFCFVCLKQWSKVKAECPLCKQPFTSIFHNLRSNESYDVFHLPPRNVPPPMDYNLYGLVDGNIRTMAAASYPPFLNYPDLNADLTLSNFSRFQFRHRRLHHHHSQHPVHGEHQYSYTGVQVNPATHINGEHWARGPEDFRREIYRRRMGPPVVVLGMETSTYRLTPAMVAASNHRMQRIMPWLTRELRVLLHSHQSVRLAISVIQPLLTQLTLDSEEFLSQVTPLLGRRARLFMQQFVAFANSALTMQVFDRRAMYQRPDYSNTLPVSSSGSSSSDEDVVEITSVSSPSNNNASNNNNNNNREGRGVTSGARVPTSTVPSNSLLSGLLSNHGWDSPIPGPSWETLNVVDDDDVQIQEDPVSVSSETDDPVYRPDERNPDSDDSKAGSDLVFLKYDKPWNERSPINLSSSSEAEEPIDHSKKKKKSKHKKKSKDLESKSHKPSLKIKIRRKHKVRRSKDNEEDDYEVGSDSSDEDDRIGSGDRSGGKRHKKSRDRSRKSSRKASERNSDRELVDRLFAEAITQPDLTSIFQDDPTTTSFQTDSVENKQSSSKGKEKRKKKRRNSSSPSTSRAYKKHHSGHKKSSDPSRASHTQRHSSRDGITPGHSGQASLNAASASVSMSPSVQRPGTFQPSFLPIPDTVQHIPLNLWVSTWPALSVSTHAFGSAPPTSTALPPPIPHALNLSSPRTGGGLAPRTISSGSSTDDASDDEQAVRGKASSIASGSHKRTKKWVETNFFNSHASASSDRGPAVSASTVPCTSQTSKLPVASASSDQQPKKSSSFSTDFLLNLETSKLSSSSSGPATASATIVAKQTIELVCSSDEEQNDEVLVCSSDNEDVSDTNSIDQRKNSQDKEIEKLHSKSNVHGQSTADSGIEKPNQDVSTSTLNPESTSSRLIAYKPSHSKTKTNVIDSPVPTAPENEPEGTLGNLLDFALDCEQPSVDSFSASISQPSSLNHLEEIPMEISRPLEPVATTSTIASNAPSILTSSACQTSTAVITVAVTTAPFYLFPSSSSQSSTLCMPSVQPEGGYLPYSPIATAPISLPPLLPPPVPLGIPKVPSLPNAFPFHHPITPIIPPAAELFQLCPQSQEASGSIREGSRNATSNASSTEVPCFSTQMQANEQASPAQVDNKTMTANKPVSDNSARPILSNPFPLLSVSNSAPQENLGYPVQVNTVASSALPFAQLSGPDVSLHSSIALKDKQGHASPLDGSTDFIDQGMSAPFPALPLIVQETPNHTLLPSADERVDQSSPTSLAQCNDITRRDQVLMFTDLPSSGTGIETDNKGGHSNETEMQISADALLFRDNIRSIMNTCSDSSADLPLPGNEIQPQEEVFNMPPAQTSQQNTCNDNSNLPLPTDVDSQSSLTI